MAIKIFISGNAVRATDLAQPFVPVMDVLKNKVYYFNQSLNNGTIRISKLPLDLKDRPDLDILLSEAVDELGVPFTAETFRTFANRKLGNVNAPCSGADFHSGFYLIEYDEEFTIQTNKQMTNWNKLTNNGVLIIDGQLILR